MANLSNINNKFLVTTGGNVGIGTTSPVAKFEVTDGSSSITLQEYSNGAAIFLDGVNGDFIGGDYFHILADGNSYLGLGGYGGGTTPLNITNAGNVGIGTSSPSEKLYVASSAGYIATFQSTTATDFRPIRFLNSAGANVGFLGNNGSNNEFFLIAQDRPLIFGTGNGGAERMRITAAGTVGIGTTSPFSDLSINVGVNAPSSSGNMASEGVTIHNGSGGRAVQIGVNESGAYNYIQSSYVNNSNVAVNLAFFTGASERMRIDTSGRVGVGTTSPNHKLDIYSNENVPLRIHRPNNANLDSSGAWGIGFSTRSDSVTSTTDTRAGIFSYYNGNLFFATNTSSIVADPDASARMTITSAGYVGIGTTTPGNTLDVAGDTDITGQLVVSHNANYVAKFVNTATSMSNNNYTLMVDSSSHTSNLSTAGAMSVDVNSGRAFTITGQGRIGIGTSSPNTKLEVQGGAGSGTHAHATFTATANRGLKISTTSSPHGQNSGTVLYDAQDTEGYSEQHWLLGGNTKMVLNKDGNLGINTTSPSATLDVSGSGALFMTRTSAGLATYIENDGGYAALYMYQLGGGQRVKIHANSTSFFNGGNIGIGTTSPAAKLDVNGATYVRNVIYGYAGGGNQYGGLSWGGTDEGFLFLKDSNVTKVNINSNGNSYLNGGNVGIGTTSPSHDLEISGVGGDGTPLLQFTGSASATYNWISSAMHANLASGETSIHLFGQAESSKNSGYIGYLYSSSGSDNNAVTIGHYAANHLVNILANGNVGINVTSPSDKLEVTTSTSQYTGRFDYTGSSGGAYGCLKLRISANTSPSFIDLFYDGFSTNPLSPVGAIVTTGSAVLYSSFSDYRLKENVADLTGALDRVNSLQPKTFNYINRPETTNEGFLAHELQEIVPQAVSGTKDGVDEDGNPKYQGVDNAHLVPLLVGAIKELKAEIELLKNK